MDRDYTLNYVVNGAPAVAVLRHIRAELVGMGQDTIKAAADVSMLDQQLAATRGTLGQLQVSLATSGGSVQTFGGTLGGLMPAWQVFEYGVELAKLFGEEINKARDRMRELGTEATQTRDKFRELANLKGETGPNDAVVAGAIALGVEAGLKPEEAARYLEQFEGSAPAGRQKGNSDPATEAALATEGAKFGARVKLNPQTSGDLTGVLSQYGKIDSVEQGAGQLGAIAHGLNEGRGNLEPLVRSLIKTAGSVVEEQGGPVSSLPELAAIIGVASTNATPDRAGTHTLQAVRGLRHFKLDDHNEARDKQTETLLGVGIKPGMNFMDSLARLAPRIRDADKAGTGGDVWLRQHGFDNDEEVRALVQFARNEDVLKQRVAAALGQGEGKKVMQADEDFFTKEKAGVARRGEAEGAAQDWLTGQKQEMLEQGRRAGSRMLREEGWVGGVANAARVSAANLFGILPGVGFKDQRQAEAEVRFMNHLIDEGDRVGVDVFAEHQKKFPGKWAADGTPLVDVNQEFDAGGGDFVNETIAKVMAAGGKPFGDQAKTRKKLDDQVEAQKADELARVIGTIEGQGARAGLDVQDEYKAANYLTTIPSADGSPGTPNTRRYPPANLLSSSHRGPGHDTEFIEQTVARIREKGVDPFGGSKTLEAKFDQLIKEARRTNEIIRGDRPGLGPMPPGANALVPGRK